jgi:hypothetical protein
MPEYPRALSYTRLAASPLARARTPVDRQPSPGEADASTQDKYTSLTH